MASSAHFTIGVDLGGTNIKAGLLDERVRLIERVETPTQADRGVDQVIARMVELIRGLQAEVPSAQRGNVAVGVGVPGPMSHAQGLVHSAPNLPGWRNVPLRDRLRAALNLSVTVENDANAAAFGEFTAGAGREASDLFFLTLGTGVGGGIILDGQLWRGRFDNAGEIGHVIVQPDGRACPCGQRGCLERYSSASAVVERYCEAVRDGAATTLAAKLPQLDAAMIEAAGRQHDELAARIWDETCYYLAVAIVNIQHMLNVQLVVLGGGMASAGASLLGPVRKAFSDLTWRLAPDEPQIVLATLGNDAGLLGAAALARRA